MRMIACTSRPSSPDCVQGDAAHIEVTLHAEHRAPPLIQTTEDIRMSIASRHSKLALVPLMLAAVAACSDSSISGPNRLTPNAPTANVATSVPGTVLLCARGFAGLSTYSLSYTPGSGSSDTYALPLGNSVALLAGSCATVFTATLTEPLLFDPTASVAITQLTTPAGSVLDYTISTEFAVQPICNPDTDPCGFDTKGTSALVNIQLNAYHGSVVTYFAAALGCAYSQGFWKNHTSSWPAGYSPSAAFFSSGKTWLEMFNTPPKGDAYYILAHQYGAAALNVANGAYMPPTTKTVFDAAAAYFAGGAGGDLTAWASVLDSFNNGLVIGGPPHCE
jgi:hypothetical protein